SGRFAGSAAFDGLRLQLTNQIITALGGDLAHLHALQHRAVGIRLAQESAGTFQDRAEAVTFLNAIAAGMHYFTVHRDGAADIGPSAELANGEAVAGLQPDIGIRFTLQRARDRDLAMLDFDVPTADDAIAGQVGSFGIGAALEAAGKAQQVGSAHALGKRILAGTQHVAINRNFGGVDLVASINAHGIERLQTRRFGFLVVHVAEIEANNVGPIVRRVQAHDLRAVGGLGHQIIKACDQVGNIQAIAKRIFTRTKDVAFEINRFIAEGQNREHKDAVAIFHREALEHLDRRRIGTSISQAGAEHLLVLVRFDTFYLDGA